MGKGNSFGFKEIIGREYCCGDEEFRVTSSDREKAKSRKDEEGHFFWEIPCRKCGGHQRFYSTGGVHLTDSVTERR